MISKLIAAARRHWSLLNQSIYVGEKYEMNMAAIGWFGLICRVGSVLVPRRENASTRTVPTDPRH